MYEYRVVSHINREQFETEINTLSQNGYHPYGEMSVIVFGIDIFQTKYSILMRRNMKDYDDGLLEIENRTSSFRQLHDEILSPN